MDRNDALIYFAQEENGWAVKIGCTRSLTSLRARLVDMQTGNPRRLEIIGVMDGDTAVERDLHRRFASGWISGEWHAYTRELEEFITEHATRPSIRQPQRRRAVRLGWGGEPLPADSPKTTQRNI